MGLMIVGGFAVGVATYANSEEDSPVLWGILTALLCIIGGVIFGPIGNVIAGCLAFGLLMAKLAIVG